MKEITPQAQLNGLCYLWRNYHKKSFVEVIKLWIFAHRNNLQLPKDALKVFADGVEKQYENYKIQNSSLEIADGKHLLYTKLMIYKYVNLWIAKKGNQRGSITEAFDRFETLWEKSERTPTLNYENIKKIYYRMVRHMLEVRKEREE